MTDTAYAVLDELYFLTPYHRLREQVDLSEQELCDCLLELLQQGWVRAFLPVEQEVEQPLVGFADRYAAYAYLATKEGLMAHNRR